MKKISFPLVALVFTGASLFLPGRVTAAPLPQSAATPEQVHFVTLVNGLRASRALPPVVLDDRLTHNAQAWAESMAARNRLQHQSLRLTMFGMSARAENVGLGPNIPTINHRLVFSHRHFRNLTNPAYNRIGIGVAHGANNRLYAAQEFGRQ